VSDYGLDDRAIGVRFPAGAKDLSSSLCVQTGSGVHPASCPMGTGGPFPGAKCGRGVTLTTHPQLVGRSSMSRSYTSSLPKRLHGVYRCCFAKMNFFSGRWCIKYDRKNEGCVTALLVEIMPDVAMATVNDIVWHSTKMDHTKYLHLDSELRECGSSHLLA
jgi:hypothetical protein